MCLNVFNTEAASDFLETRQLMMINITNRNILLSKSSLHLQVLYFIWEHGDMKQHYRVITG